MKKILAVSMIMIAFVLTGCTECVSTEYENVSVTITDTYYRRPMRRYPAVYTIYATYNDVEYSVGGMDTYEKYENQVGQTAMGVLEIRTYDDGTVKQKIVSLE